jgi:hypothetical protein
VRTGEANPSKDPKQRQQYQQQRRNSGYATSTPTNNIRQQYNAVTPSSMSQVSTSSASASRGLAITVNRSRLVQELLEQNSAMLLKLKDRPEVTTSEPSSVSLGADTVGPVINEGNQQQPQPQQQASLINSSSMNSSNGGANPIHHHPFPRNLARPPKDVTVKLGLYNCQKF